MSSPSYSILYSAKIASSGNGGAAGTALLPDASTGLYVVATSAARGTRRTTGIALTPFVPNGVVEIQQLGRLDASVAGIGAGSASWVRVSSTGTLERCTPTTGDDVVGWGEADGAVYLLCGVLTPGIVTGGVVDATPLVKGILKLAGDFRGTADAPLVASLTGDTFGVLDEKIQAAMSFEPASRPHTVHFAGRLEQAVNNATSDVQMMPLSGADPCVVRCCAEVVAEDTNFASTSTFSAVPVATFKWSGSALTRVSGGLDPAAVKNAFTGDAEWVASGSDIKLRLTTTGNARFGVEFRLARIR